MSARLVRKMYMHICATYEVTVINHVTGGTVHIFDIYHWTNMVATLHIHVQVHCYSSAPIDQMTTKCKLTIAITNKHAHTITYVHLCAKFEPATTTFVACSTVYRTMN